VLNAMEEHTRKSSCSISILLKSLQEQKLDSCWEGSSGRLAQCPPVARSQSYKNFGITRLSDPCRSRPSLSWNVTSVHLCFLVLKPCLFVVYQARCFYQSNVSWQCEPPILLDFYIDLILFLASNIQLNQLSGGGCAGLYQSISEREQNIPLLFNIPLAAHHESRIEPIGVH
jgi:hypothetical protein